MRSALLVGLLAGIHLAWPAKADVIETFDVGIWDGMAYADDEDGQFAHCAMYSNFENGISLFLAHHRNGSWILLLTSDDFKFTKEDRFPVRYRIDRRNPVSVGGEALETNQLNVLLQDEDAFLDQLRRGNRLTISFEGEDYVFPLSSSSRALDKTEECYGRYMAALQTATPDEPAAAEPAPPEGSGSEVATQTPVAPAPTADSDAPAAPAEGAEQQKIGPWVVTPASDADGKFVNCTAYGVFGDDQLILSYFPDGIWTFGLYRSAWSLNPQETYFLSYNVDAPVDAAGVLKRPVEAAEPTRIFFEAGELDNIIDRIESGRELNLQLRGFSQEPEDLSYPLDQAPAALEATRQCTEQASQNASAPATDDAAEAPADVDGEAADAPNAGHGGEEQTAEAGETDQGAPADGFPASPSLPAIGETRIEEVEVPGWQGGAFADAEGTFTHCSISAEYQNETTLAFARTAEGSLLMALHRTDWTLDPETWSAITYEYNGGSLPISVSGEGQAVNENLYAVNMGSEDLFINQLRTAPQLTVETQGKELVFDISDIGPGLEAIDTCAERQRQAAAEAQSETARPAAKKVSGSQDEPDRPTNPAPAGKVPPVAAPEGEQQSNSDAAADPEASTAVLKEEAAGFTTALLVRSGYAGHSILTGDDVPEAMRNRAAAWQIGEIMGITDVVQGTLDELRERVGSQDKADCRGSSVTKVISEHDAGIAHVASTCDQSGTDIFVHYVFVPRGGDNEYYMLAFIGLQDGAAAEAMAAKVYGTAVRS